MHIPAQRVGQLDASALDSELLDLVKGQLWDAFKHFRPDIKDKYESELLLVLRLALFKLTVWDNDSTYGAHLQNLKFVKASSTSRHVVGVSRNQKALYGILAVGGDYLWSKIDDYIITHNASHAENGQLSLVKQTLDLMWNASSLLNFVLFLYSGKYSTLILRLLRIRLAPITKNSSKNVNYEFQNRQLVWNTLTEFLLYILPLVNLARLKIRISRFLSGNASATRDPSKLLSYLPERTCAICYSTSADSTSLTEVTNPYVGSCGHIYCYVCIKTQLADNNEWPCRRCGKSITSAIPYRDIAAPDEKEYDGKESEEKSDDEDAESDEEQRQSTFIVANDDIY